jgi:hypothetical protein
MENVGVSVGDVLGAAGEPATIDWNGKTYKLAPLTYGAVTRTEMLVAKSVSAELESMRGELPDGQFRRLEADLTAKLLGRAHRAGGALFTEVMSSADGQVMYLLALLREHHPDATETDARRMMADVPDRVERAILLVTPDFLRLVAATKGADPRRVQAALDQLSRSTGSSPGSPA